MALNKNIKAFIIYISFFSLELIYPIRKAQIASLLTEEVIILDKYSDFIHVFSKQQVFMLLE